MQKKGKRNKYRLAIEGKRRNTGVCRNKLAKSLERYKEKDLLFKEKQRTVWRKTETVVEGGVLLALKTETLLQKREK